MNPTPRKSSKQADLFRYPIVDKKLILRRPGENEHISNFFETLAQRKSITKLGALNSHDLDYLLWYACRVKDIAVDNGYILSHRPSPSAGAIHPIDILVHHPANDFLYYYSPLDHSLYQLDFEKERTDSFLSHISVAFPSRQATLLWFVAHSYRTEKYYGDHESLIWRDSGALVQTLQLTATALGLGSCPVGTLAEPYVTHLHGNFKSISSGGGIIVGSI